MVLRYHTKLYWLLWQVDSVRSYEEGGAWPRLGVVAMTMVVHAKCDGPDQIQCAVGMTIFFWIPWIHVQVIPVQSWSDYHKINTNTHKNDVILLHPALEYKTWIDAILIDFLFKINISKYKLSCTNTYKMYLPYCQHARFVYRTNESG